MTGIHFNFLLTLDFSLLSLPNCLLSFTVSFDRFDHVKNDRNQIKEEVKHSECYQEVAMYLTSLCRLDDLAEKPRQDVDRDNNRTLIDDLLNAGARVIVDFACKQDAKVDEVQL